MSLFDDDIELQTSEMPVKTLSLKRQSKRDFISAMKKEEVKSFLTKIPKNGETLHIVSNGKFDFWSFIPVILNLMGGHSFDFYGSTWTINRDNVNDLFRLHDNRMIGNINMMTGLYFKQRESSVYATLVEGILERGQNYICLETHAKIVLLQNGKDYITIEGSANFTSNPRIEQYAISNDKGLFDFHKKWMDDILLK
jgi:hypothetical protein